MKANVILILVLGILIGGCSGGKIEKKNDLDGMNLSGNVKSLSESTYKAIEQNGEIVKVGVDIDFVGKSLPNDWKMYKFSQDGKITEKSESEPAGVFIGAQRVYEYDDKGFLNRVLIYKGMQVVEIDIYKRDKYGKTLEYFETSSQGKLYEKSTNLYDKKGDLTENNEYDSKGNLVERTKYEYDKKGYLIQLEVNNPDGKITNRAMFQNDKNGKQIDQKVYNSKGTYTVELKTKYDDTGNKIMEDYFYPQSSVRETYTYEYEFDEKGNWIKRVDTKSDIPRFIVEREIEYY